VKGMLNFRNRQRERKINLPALKKILRSFLKEFAATRGDSNPLAEYDLGIHLVNAIEIERLHQTWLHHQGSTDVITFDYCDPAQPQRLAGDIFVCVSVAIAQAKTFKTTWQSELVRYVVHGILHLAGFDDRTTKKRTEMKRVENHWIRVLSRQFDPNKIGSPRGKFD